MVRYKFVHFNKRSDFDSYVPNPESNSANGNEYYNYVVFIKDTKEIYTHGQFYNCSDSGDASIDEIIEELKSAINSKADLSSLETLIKEVEENEEVTAAALTELHENKADKSEIPDVSAFATKDELNTLSAEVDNKVDSVTFTTLSETVAGHTTSIDNLSNNKADKTELEDYATTVDLNTKQDLLVSGTNIKTVNSNSILGSGNIETPDTKVTSAANHYGYNSNNATSTTGAFVTKITKDAANHVTSFESRALTSTDIPGLDASKITFGTIDIARLPKGALEQLHHYETKELAQQAVIDKAVQLGDTVQINNAIMYICTNDSATTFATQFTEYVAGTAASVPWSGITGKPTGIDEWGNRIGVIESGYATKSWVGENYLPLSGGILCGTLEISPNNDNPLTITSNKKDADGANRIKFIDNERVFQGYVMTGWGNLILSHRSKNVIGVGDDGIWCSSDNSNTKNAILHSGNYSNLLAGGTINGSLTATSFIGNLTGNADSATKLSTARTIWGQSFNGTGNVSGDLTGVPKIQNKENEGLYIMSNTHSNVMPTNAGNLGKAVGIGMHPSFGTFFWNTDAGHSHIQVGRSDGNATAYNLILQEFGGNVAIGGTTADEKLHIYGNIKASGSMYAVDFVTTSDNRLKDFTKDVDIDFENLKNIPKKYYYWKDKSMGEDLQLGTSAQELAKVYPECVHYDETNDRYSVNYQKLSIVALAAIDKLHDRISELESKLYD